MIISLQQHINDSTSLLRKNLEKYSVAILTTRFSKEPVFIGTGFCLRHRKMSYFVTAKHVTDQCTNGVYLGKERVRQFESRGYRTNGDTEKFDIAVMPIAQEKISEIGISVVDSSQSDLHDSHKEGFHCLIGYPASKNKTGKAIHVGNRTINSRCYAINTHRINIEYAKYNKSAEAHIALAYSTAKNADGGEYQPPSLKGVSGAPLWVTKDRFDLNNVRLAGFLIENHRKGKVAFCTKVIHVLGFIEARYT